MNHQVCKSKIPESLRQTLKMKGLEPEMIPALADLPGDSGEVFFSRVSAERLSQQELAKVLEWGCELILFGKEPQWDEIPSGRGFLPSLRKLRFPQTAKQDEQSETTWKSLPWPAGAKGKLVRQGDRSFFHLTLELKDKSDFRKKLDRLEKVWEQMTDD